MHDKLRNSIIHGSLAVMLSYIPQTYAIPLLTQADNSYGTLALLPNDDGSSNSLSLAFDVNFFGNTYNEFFINNNGNITFESPVNSFTPRRFPVSTNPMIAPFWADVDTRCSTCGEVFVGAVNADTTIVTWNDVGYFNRNANLANDFQLVLRNRSADTGNIGDFDVEFRYNRLEWTTGDFSGGVGGLGGTPAQAGYDAGDGSNFFQLPGSFTSDVLDLQNTSNVSPDTPGLWSFSIRDGALPGETPDNPLLPIITDTGFQFDFNVVLNQQVFIDPVIAIGYDYEIISGENFASVVLPNVGDNVYDLWLWNGTEYVDTGTNIFAGAEYIFGDTGVDRFRIMGIEIDALLDPVDPLAFVTGLTFTGVGLISMTQSAIAFDTAFVPIDPINPVDPVDPTAVSEPSSLLLLGLGMIGFTAARRRKNFYK